MVGMSNYEDWTAGQHWREAMANAGEFDGEGGDVGDVASCARALFHLAAAHPLLDHSPAPFAHLRADWQESPEDWRDG
jgi:hypothetical protein